MTPTKQQIYDMALELYYSDLTRSGTIPEITPTTEELKESGFWMVAQNQLMRNTDSYSEWLQQEVDETHATKTKVYPFAFDWKNEVYRSNILVSGTNSTGKSRLAAKLANILKTVGWQIICFDNSSVWRQISDIPIYIEISESENYFEIPILGDKSVVYDISALVPQEQKQLVDFVLLDLWNNRDNDNFSYVMVILEESQLYCRNLRGNLSQHLMRIFSAGRNKQIRCMAITVDLALLDPSFIRLCQQRYHGRLGIEMGGKRRFKSYYGKEWMETATQLDLGKFIYLNKNKLQQINVPLFEAKHKPISYHQYLQSLQPQPQKQKGFWAKVLERLQ